MRLTVAEIAAKLSVNERDPSLTLRQVRHMAARGLLSEPRTSDGRGTQSFPVSAVFEAELLLHLADFGVVEGAALREVVSALHQTPNFDLRPDHKPERCRTVGPALREVFTGTQEHGERWVLTLAKRIPEPHFQSLGLKDWRASVLPIAAAMEELVENPTDRDFLGRLRVTLVVDLSSLVSDVSKLIAEQG